LALDKLLFFDLETTSTDIFQAEIIEGFFLDSLGKEYHMKSQVDTWSDEAQKIHKISQAKMQSYPQKAIAHIKAYNWLEKYEHDYLWICYSNPKNIYGHINYDRGVLINSFLEMDIDFTIDKILSVYDLAVEASKRSLFAPIKGSKGRISYSQENVYKALFNESYNAHNAKEDVLAMKRIYETLTNSLMHNTPYTSGQTKLI